MSILSWGNWPSRSTKARITPAVLRDRFTSLLASLLSSTKSSPLTLITIWPSIWEMLSSTLSRMGCENDTSSPGSLETASSIATTIFGLVMPARHCASGFNSTKASKPLKIFGSVPSSGRPTLLITVTTSGTWRNWARMRPAINLASSGETDGGKVALTQIVPSSSSGKNSEPSVVATAAAIASATAAISITARGAPTAQRKAGA